MATKPEKQLTLLQTATMGARITRQTQIVQFILDGNGAFVTFTADYAVAEKWANSKYGGGNRMMDRNRFLDQLQTLIARPGSFVSTRGSTKPLEDLCKLMKAAGFDLGEWQLPPDLKNAGNPKPPEPVKKKPAEAQPEGEEKPDTAA